MKQNNQLNISVLLPGGNRTVLVRGIMSIQEKKKANNQLMKDYAGIEQVGFYTYSPALEQYTLEMAGGEFCGNALRSLAFLVLNGKKGEITAKVSGARELLKAGMSSRNTSWAQIPTVRNKSAIVKVKTNLYQVAIPGITYLITENAYAPNSKNLKKVAKNLLKENNLLNSQKASGIIFLSDDSIKPFVWVQAIKTFFYESSCASGSAATAIYLSKIRNIQSPIKLVQPSGKILTVYLKTNKGTIQPTVSGPCKKEI